MKTPGLLSVLVILLFHSQPVSGRRRVKRQANSSSPCKFVPVNNHSFIEDIYPFFDEDSSTRILEYDITFVNQSREFLAGRSHPYTFQPWRWFRTQGVGVSQLLLVYHYYYGLVKPFMRLGIAKREVRLIASPEGCLDQLMHSELEAAIRDHLLTDFNIDSAVVDFPFIYSDDVEICTAHIEDVDGWGRLVYRCCGHDSEDRLRCHDVFEDAWVWVLRALVVTLTIILFLYFPTLIPTGYRIYSYVYYPPDGLKFNFKLTDDPDSIRKVSDCLVLSRKQWQRMKQFQTEIPKLQTNVTYTADVQRVHFIVGMDRLVQEGGSPVNMTRSFFDAFVRCKIRHSDPLESCCKTPACGIHCYPNCPPWQTWLRGVRTIFVMLFLALPSLPFMYAISAEGLDYQQLADAYEAKGLERSFNFYTGATFGKIIVGIVAFMYVVHAIIIIVDGATDQNISQMYTDVLDVSERKDSIEKRVVGTKSTIRKFFRPVQKYGVLIIPLWLIAICLLPVYFVLMFILKAPMFRLIFKAFKRLLIRINVIKSSHEQEGRLLKFCEVYWFFITIVFVFIVLTIGANFIVHVIAMIIVKIVIDAALVYRVLPVVLLLLLYIRDSSRKVGEKYQTFLDTVLGTVKNKEAEDLRRETLKSWENQENKIFKILPDPVPVEEDKQVNNDNGYAVLPNSEPPMPKKEKQLFLIKNGNLRLHLKQLLLFLNRNDFLYMSRKFLFHCCTMDCAGAPGILEENYIDATLDFLKIGVFLLFVFLVVMAYGNAYYISPTNHMFVTLVSGLVPLVLRNLFLKSTPVNTVDTSNYRFEAQLRNKIESFSQSWDVEDIKLKGVQVATIASTVKVHGAPSTWSISLGNTNSVDLVLDVSGKTPDEEKGYRGLDYNLKLWEHKSRKVGIQVCPHCRNSSSVLAQTHCTCGRASEKDFFADKGLDIEGNGNGRTSNRNNARWLRYNGGPYDNERHREAVNTAHDRHTDEVVAGIDSHLVTNALLNVFGLTDEKPKESHESRSRPPKNERRPISSRPGTTTARNEDLLDAYMATTMVSALTADDPEASRDGNGGGGSGGGGGGDAGGGSHGVDNGGCDID